MTAVPGGQAESGYCVPGCNLTQRRTRIRVLNRRGATIA